MKKILSILLALALAAGLAVTALAAGTVEIPSGDNVVKLTDKGVAEDYNGDLYLEFSVTPTQGKDGYLEVPVGTTFKVYCFKNGSFYKLAQDVTRLIDFKKGNDWMPNVKNENGTVTFTCSTEGEYVFSSSAPASGGWILESTPKIRVTSAPVQPIEPPTGDNVVMLEGSTVLDGVDSGDLYLEFSIPVTAIDDKFFDREITVPTGTTVRVYWFKNGEFQPITSDSETCILSFETLYGSAKSVYNADGTVTFTLINFSTNSTPSTYSLMAFTDEGRWGFGKILSIIVNGSASSAEIESSKVTTLFLPLLLDEGQTGPDTNYGTLIMRFDQGINETCYYDGDDEPSTNPNYAGASGKNKLSTVIDVPAGTTIRMTLCPPAGVALAARSAAGIRDAGDFYLRRVNFSGGKECTYADNVKIMPTNQGITSTFTLTQSGYYLLAGQNAGRDWLLQQTGYLTLIHVTGSAVNPSPGTGGQSGGTGTGGQGGTGGETDPGTGLPPIFPPFTDKHEGYMSGYPDGTIRPNGTVTRAEMVSIIFRLLEDGVRASHLRDENAYSDVNKGSWYNTAISTVTDLDYISGYGDGTFRPDQPITRAEVASIIARFVGYSAGSVTVSAFSDVDPQSWYAGAVNFVKSKSWMVGDSGKFRPNDPITRAEAMATMNRVLGRSPSEDSFLLVKNDGKFIQWPDNRNKSVWYYADIQEATHSHKYMAFSKDGGELWTEIVRMRDWSLYSY